jgi:hypothetical protein
MIEFAGVSKIYPNRVTALQGVSFRIENGEFVHPAGPASGVVDDDAVDLVGDILESIGDSLERLEHLARDGEIERALARDFLKGAFQPDGMDIVGFTLQLDQALIDALHDRGFRIAVESNGTLPAVEGIDWLCISPKAGTEVVQRSGDELKLVWPQEGVDPAGLESWDFANFLIQPMDCEAREQALDAAIRLVMERPRWRLSLQAHKLIGLP